MGAQVVLIVVLPLLLAGVLRWRGAAKDKARARGGSIAQAPTPHPTYQPGVIALGDHNHAAEVQARFGPDQTVLLGRLVAALRDVAGRQDVAEALRIEAGMAADALTNQPASQLPAVLQRIRGAASVGGTAFDAVRPLLDQIRF